MVEACPLLGGPGVSMCGCSPRTCLSRMSARRRSRPGLRSLAAHPWSGRSRLCPQGLVAQLAMQVVDPGDQAVGELAHREQGRGRCTCHRDTRFTVIVTDARRIRDAGCQAKEQPQAMHGAVLVVGEVLQTHPQARLRMVFLEVEERGSAADPP